MIKITKQIREFITSNTQLSANARLLYLLLADRAELSSKNAEKFSDEHGVFIYFTVAEVQEVLGCAVATAVKVLDELEHNGFIVRKHTQRADKIYISHFSKNETCTFQKLESADSKNYNLHISKIETNQKSTEKKPNNQPHTESSSSSSPSATRQQIVEQIEYSKMIEDDADSKPVLDILVDLLVENYDNEITSAHLKQIVENVKKRSKHSNIVNMKAYLKSCLKNIKAELAIKNAKAVSASSVSSDRHESDWEILKHVSATKSDLSKDEYDNLSDLAKLNYLLLKKRI